MVPIPLGSDSNPSESDRPGSRGSEHRPDSRGSMERPDSRASEERPDSRASETRPLSRGSEGSAGSHGSNSSSEKKRRRDSRDQVNNASMHSGSVGICSSTNLLTMSQRFLLASAKSCTKGLGHIFKNIMSVWRVKVTCVRVT